MIHDSLTCTSFSDPAFHYRNVCDNCSAHKFLFIFVCSNSIYEWSTFFCKRHESYALNLFCFGYTLPISIYIKKKYLETGETVHRNSGNCEKHGHDMMYNRTCTFTYYYNYLFRLRAKAEDDMAWPLRYLLTSKSFLLSAVILF